MIMRFGETTVERKEGAKAFLLVMDGRYDPTKTGLWPWGMRCARHGWRKTQGPRWRT